MFEGNLQVETARRCLYLIQKHCPRIMSVAMAEEAARKDFEAAAYAALSPQQKKLLKYRENERIARRARIEQETPEERERRLYVNRERVRRTRAKKKAERAKA